MELTTLLYFFIASVLLTLAPGPDIMYLLAKSLADGTKAVSSLNKFTDLKNNSHWAFYAIAESANTHIGVIGTDNETWVK